MPPQGWATDEMMLSPSLESQALELGGHCEYLSEPSHCAPDVVLNNMSLMRTNRGLIVAQRRLQNRNGEVTLDWRENPSTILLRLRANEATSWKTLSEITLLNDENPMSVEDARIVDIGDHGGTLLAAIWPFEPKSSGGPHRAVTSQAWIALDRDWKVKGIRIPAIGDNRSPTRYEKNWMPMIDIPFFSYSLNRTHCVYSLDGSERYVSPGLTWSFGEIHGGTQWVPEGGTRLGIFHSSLPIAADSWAGMPHNQKYFVLGAVRAELDPPFRIVAYTPQPILWSSVRNPRVRNGSILLFANGLSVRGSNVEIAVGVNDAASAIVRLPLRSIESLLQSPEDHSGSVGESLD